MSVGETLIHVTAAEYLPERLSLHFAREAARVCRGSAGAPPRRRSSAKARRTRAVSSSASSPATRRTSKGRRSWAPPAGSSTRRSTRRRHRPGSGLRHERGQALQVAAAREAADPPEAHVGRDDRVQAVARGGARSRPAASDRRPRRDRGPGALRTAVPGHEAAGEPIDSPSPNTSWRRSTRPRSSARRTRDSEYASTVCFVADLEKVAELL